MISALVIAGNYRQYATWLLENQLYDHIDYKYVSKPEDVAGFHNIPIFLVGEYWLNPLYNLHIENYIQGESNGRI
jgi:hypothetical protein